MVTECAPPDTCLAIACQEKNQLFTQELPK